VIFIKKKKIMAAGEIFRCGDDDVYMHCCDRFPKDGESWFLRNVLSPLEAYNVITQWITIYNIFLLA
jgi:hypothetical protein